MFVQGKESMEEDGVITVPVLVPVVGNATAVLLVVAVISAIVTVISARC